MKKLVAYFTAERGTTKEVASIIAQSKDCDLYEIKPLVPYTKKDLNWMDKNSRSSVEMREMTRVKLADYDAKIEDYDVIYLGFPIWWYKAPSIINSFLESYDFTNKKIVLFATAGSQKQFRDTVENLKVSAEKAEFVESKIFLRFFNKDDVIKSLAEY